MGYYGLNNNSKENQKNKDQNLPPKTKLASLLENYPSSGSNSQKNLLPNNATTTTINGVKVDRSIIKNVTLRN